MLKSEVNSEIDPLQFDYRQGRSTDDAINSLTHLTLKHLEDPKANEGLLFIDFSSAFNKLQPHLLLQKMTKINGNPFIIKWFYSFLTNRTLTLYSGRHGGHCRTDAHPSNGIRALAFWQKVLNPQMKM